MILVFAIEFLVILATFLGYIYEKGRGYDSLDMRVDVKDFSSDYISYDNGWYIDSNMVDVGDDEPINVLYGPFITLPKGEYTLVMDYECEEDQEARPYSSSKNDYIVANPVNLDKNLCSRTYCFRTKEQIDEFEILTYYNGEGVFRINNVRLYSNLNGYKKSLFLIVCLFIIFDVCIFNKEQIINHKKETVLLTAITILVSMPLFMDGMVYPVGDTDFHLMRIEGIYNELLLGHIPARIQSVWGSGNGYPVSVFYGDILLYIPAFLRLMGFTVTFAYAAFVFFINVITVLISFFSFKTIVRNINLSLLMTLTYVTATYRMVGIYKAGIVGTYSAMCFLPMAAAAIFLIYTDEEKMIKPNLRYAMILAVAMTGIITAHSLSTVMAIEVLLLFCLLEIRKTIRPRTILTLLSSILFSGVLSMYYIIPFLDYYFNVDTVISCNSDSIHHIQSGGVYLFQLFAFYQDPYETSTEKIPGMPFIVVFVAIVLLWIFGVIKDHDIKVLTVLSGIIMLVSTNLFPWDWLAYHSKIVNFLAQVQFSMRYLVFACITLTVLMGLLLDRIGTMKLIRDPSRYNVLLIGTATMALIGVIVFYGQLAEHATIYNVVDGTEIPNDTRIGGEYVRVGTDGEPIHYIRKTVESVNADVEVLSREGWTLDMDVHTEESPGLIKTPFTNYKGYQAFDSEGNHFDIIDDEYCKTAFIVPGNYNGLIKVTFVEPWYWRASEIVSLVAWLGLICYVIVCMRKRNAAQI